MYVSADELLQGLRAETALRDFTIASETGVEWKVHKLVLYMHSDVLYRMSTSADFIECQSGRATLKDVDDDCIEKMIQYLYDLKIEFPNFTSSPPQDSRWYSIETIRRLLSFVAGLWTLGDMYNMRKMRDEVIDKFGDWLHMHFDWELDFGRTVEAVHQLDWVPKEMQDVVIKFVAAKLGRSHTRSVEDTKKVLDKYPKFAAEVLMEVVAMNSCEGSGPRVERWAESVWRGADDVRDTSIEEFPFVP